MTDKTSETEHEEKESRSSAESLKLKKPLYPTDENGRRIMSQEETDFFGVCSGL